MPRPPLEASDAGDPARARFVAEQVASGRARRRRGAARRSCSVRRRPGRRRGRGHESRERERAVGGGAGQAVGARDRALLLDPLVGALARAGVDPDHVTWTGLLVTGVGAFLFAAGRFREGALVAVVGCAMDMVDGRWRGARVATRWALDSTTDRIADAALFLGVGVHYARQALSTLKNEDALTDLLLGPPIQTAIVYDGVLEAIFYAGLAALAMIAALLVSYTRARMEGLGLECRAGWPERPERLVVLLGAALFGSASPVMKWALAILVVLSWFTVFQRVAYASAASRSRLTGLRFEREAVEMGKVRVAIIGVGNCASSFVQGVHYYRNAKDSDRVPGSCTSTSAATTSGTSSFPRHRHRPEQGRQGPGRDLRSRTTR